MDRGGEKEYYLASACGEIYAPPTAGLSLRGVSVAGTFLRGVLDKVGVEPQVRRIGKYKSAGDQLLRSDMSGARAVGGVGGWSVGKGGGWVWSGGGPWGWAGAGGGSCSRIECRMALLVWVEDLKVDGDGSVYFPAI